MTSAAKTYVPLAIATLIAAMSALGGTAVAKRCVPKAGALIPVVTSPCNGGTVHAGNNITFKVRDANSKAHQYKPYIELTKKKPKRGKLAKQPGTDGFFDQMSAIHGHPTAFKYRAPKYSYPGWWLITPGTYYVQVQQIDDRAGTGDTFYGPITTIHVR